MKQDITPELIAELRDRVKKKQTSKRYEHTLGVAYTAACMAFSTEVPPLKAELAGLLHDCAKCFSNEELIELCRHNGVELTNEELASPAVIHAKYGSYLARHEFGIKDEDILNAIRFHTTGRPAMSALEKLIFAADYIEPLRDKASNLDRVRRLAFTELDECVYDILKSTVEYLNEKRAVVVSDTLRAYEWYRDHRKDQI